MLGRPRGFGDDEHTEGQLSERDCEGTDVLVAVVDKEMATDPAGKHFDGRIRSAFSIKKSIFDIFLHSMISRQTEQLHQAAKQQHLV